ncbi:MAG: DUF3352 domain-containing protein [Flammeovirgaceae bacterium]
MKKKIILAVVLVLLAFVGYKSYKYFFVKVESMQSIYLIPKDAIYIIEMKDAIGSWEKVSTHPMWAHLRKNDYFAELTESANSLDALVKDSPILGKLVGKRTILVSAHMFRRDNYDFVFAVDLKRQARLPIEGIIDNFTGSGYNVTKRDYHGQKIIELYDKESRETLHISFIKNNFVGSYQAKLLEASIDQMGEPIIGRDLNYIDISKKVDNDGMFRFYMQYSYLDEYMRCYMDEEDEYVKALSEQLYYTGVDCDLKEKVIEMKGYTNINDSINSYLLAMLRSGKGAMDITKIAPQRTAFYMGLGFDSFSEFTDNFSNLLKETTEDYDEYVKNIEKVENFLDISLKDDFFGWVDDELAFIQTQPGKLGKDNEFAVVLKAKSGEDAAERLGHISEQIRKKTPVKFKEVQYKGHAINFLSVKGFFKLMLGKFFSKLEKPYFTIIDDYVIFSNHPQTIKSIIDDYVAEKTLARLEEFGTFQKEFNDKSNVFIYIQTPVLHENLKGFVSPETWRDIDKNKQFIVCFSHIGFQLTKDGDMFSTRMASWYNDPQEVQENAKQIEFEKKQKASKDLGEVILKTKDGTDSLVKADTDDLLEAVEEEEIMAIEEISIDDFTADEQEEKYEDGTLKVKFGIKDGLKHGWYYEYHPNGELKMKGKFDKDKREGVWKEYDENGKRIRKVRYRNGQAQ